MTNHPPLFIAIEGIDGSGKGTQAKLLAEFLKAKLISFPRYKSFFGKQIRRYLDGDLDLAPKMAATLYANDRFNAQEEIERTLYRSNVSSVVCDRYMASNIAHQCARVPISEREGLANWIAEMERSVLKNREPDLTIFLDVHPAIAQGLMEGKKQDRHERDLGHLTSAYSVYLELSSNPSWVSIECLDGDGMRSVEAIAQDVQAVVTGFAGSFQKEVTA